MPAEWGYPPSGVVLVMGKGILCNADNRVGWWHAGRGWYGLASEGAAVPGGCVRYAQNL